MDYLFEDKFDIKLITLFIIDNFGIPAPHSCIIDTIMLQPVVNYFDLEECLAELVSGGHATYYVEDSIRYYDITPKGKDALSYFSGRIPKTVRERLLSTIKLKEKELKKTIGISAEYKAVNEIEYKVSLSITEGTSELFNITISVGSDTVAKRMCNEFKKDPQAIYSEILAILIKDNTI